MYMNRKESNMLSVMTKVNLAHLCTSVREDRGNKLQFLPTQGVVNLGVDL